MVEFLKRFFGTSPAAGQEIEQPSKKAATVAPKRLTSDLVKKSVSPATGQSVSQRALTTNSPDVDKERKVFFHAVLASQQGLQTRNLDELESMRSITAIDTFSDDVEKLQQEAFLRSNDESLSTSERDANFNIGIKAAHLILDLTKTRVLEEKRVAIVKPHENELDRNTDTINNGLKELSNEINEYIEHLNVGGRCILFGGIPEHAMLYEIEKTDENHVSLKIIQSGLGISHHVKKDGKYQSYVVENIAIKDFQRSGFIEEALKIKCGTEKRSSLTRLLGNVWTSRSEEAVNGIYRLVKSNLIDKGYGTRKKQGFDEAQYHKEQITGTCARKVYQFLLKERLGTQDYRKAKTYITKHRMTKLRQMADIKETRQERTVPRGERADPRTHTVFSNILSKFQAFPYYLGLKQRNPVSTEELLELGQRVQEKREKKAETPDLSTRKWTHEP